MAAGGGGDVSVLVRGLLLLWGEVSRQSTQRTRHMWATSSLTASFRQPSPHLEVLQAAQPKHKTSQETNHVGRIYLLIIYII